MPTVDILVRTEVSTSIRARQVQASFDVPERKEESLSWRIDMPIESKPWHVGLIVGPSGSGKSTLMRHAFGAEEPLVWQAKSVVDDFDSKLSVADITAACGAVGFNTIPAWLRPHHVLSNGEKFRVELARRLLEQKPPIVIDEFTSLVDRQVAKVASHAAQKYTRKLGKQLVAVTCHYDVEDWLQPDWVVDVAKREFTWRSVQRRPEIACEIRRVPYSVWHRFASFHYLTADLNPAARCFALHVNGQPVAFAGVLHQPHPKVRDIVRISRLVTLPDWQGLGLGLVLCDRLGKAYAAIGKRLRIHPAHGALIRSLAKAGWRQSKKAGTFSVTDGKTSTIRKSAGDARKVFGGRPCAVFEYAGRPWPCRLEASGMIHTDAR